MSANKAKGAWSDAERISLLAQAVEQLRGPGVPIRYADINLPGRTPKSMMHVWPKLLADGLAYPTSQAAAGEDDAEPTTPAHAPASARSATAKRAPAKKRKDSPEAGNQEAAGLDTATPTKKRRATSRKKATPKAEPAPSEHEDDEVKAESENTDAAIKAETGDVHGESSGDHDNAEV